MLLALKRKVDQPEVILRIVPLHRKGWNYRYGATMVGRNVVMRTKDRPKVICRLMNHYRNPTLPIPRQVKVVVPRKTRLEDAFEGRRQLLMIDGEYL
jgi:hypothetical protein